MFVKEGTLERGDSGSENVQGNHCGVTQTRQKSLGSCAWLSTALAVFPVEILYAFFLRFHMYGADLLGGDGAIIAVITYQSTLPQLTKLAARPLLFVHIAQGFGDLLAVKRNSLPLGVWRPLESIVIVADIRI